MELTEKQKIRFFSNIDKTNPNGCWLWTGRTRNKRYGSFKASGKYYPAHRVIYELLVDIIPAGKFICHSCDVGVCCNPQHLWIGSAKDNTQDMIKKGRQWQQKKTHCRNGHEYSIENTKINKRNGSTYRHCYICQKEIRKKSNAKLLIKHRLEARIKRPLNRDKINARAARYRANNKEKIKASSLKAERRRSAKNEAMKIFRPM